MSAVLLLSVIPVDVPYAKTTPVRRLLGTQATQKADQNSIVEMGVSRVCDSSCGRASGAGSACGYARGQCCCRGWTGCYLISAFPSGWDRCS